MNLKQYPKSLGIFKEYFTQKQIEFQQSMLENYKKTYPEAEIPIPEIPTFSMDEIEKVANSLGSAIFYFFDSKDLVVSILKADDKFKYFINDMSTAQLKKLLTYNSRVEAETAAITELFTMLEKYAGN